MATVTNRPLNTGTVTNKILGVWLWDSSNFTWGDSIALWGDVTQMTNQTLHTGSMTNRPIS